MLKPSTIYAKNLVTHGGITPERIAHFDNPHRATSQPPSLSQAAHLSHSLMSEQAPPAHKHAELAHTPQPTYPSQEKQNSQVRYVEPAQVSVPITLNLVLTLQVETSQQTHSSFCSDAQNEKSSE